MRLAPVALVFAAIALTSAVRAETHDPFLLSDEVINPWEAPGPGAPPPDAAPAPEGNPEELPRRPAEFATSVGFTLPLCSKRFASVSRCPNTAFGRTAGLSALWRASPAFAWGFYGEFTRYELDGPGEVRGRANALGGGVVGRVYLFDSGKFEPWVELGLGGGAVRAVSLGAGGVPDGTTRRAGFSTRLAAGFDVLLGQHVRLGPVVDYDRVLARRQYECVTGNCRGKEFGRIDEGLTFGMSLTVALGAPL